MIEKSQSMLTQCTTFSDKILTVNIWYLKPGSNFRRGVFPFLTYPPNPGGWQLRLRKSGLVK